jgi:membrane-bound lytic murein transglycosylase F
MGFEYELLDSLARANGLALRIEIGSSEAELLDRLNRGEGDVVAARLIPTPERERRVAFTAPLYTTRPAIVQRSGPPSEAGIPALADSLLRWPDKPVGETATLRVRPIATPADLAGMTVHVPERSPYHAILAELSDTITGDIEVVAVQGDTALETLVRQISRGEIDLAVSQENLALIKQSYFQNIEVRPAIGPTHAIAWAYRKNAPRLG